VYGLAARGLAVEGADVIAQAVADATDGRPERRRWACGPSVGGSRRRRSAPHGASRRLPQLRKGRVRAAALPRGARDGLRRRPQPDRGPVPARLAGHQGAVAEADHPGPLSRHPREGPRPRHGRDPPRRPGPRPHRRVRPTRARCRPRTPHRLQVPVHPVRPVQRARSCPSATIAWPTTRPNRPSFPVQPRRNARSGAPSRPCASSPTAVASTRSSPTCSRSSSVPGCARARPSPCTGTTSRWATASCRSTAPCPRSTTGSS